MHGVVFICHIRDFRKRREFGEDEYAASHREPGRMDRHPCCLVSSIVARIDDCRGAARKRGVKAFLAGRNSLT
jgi:hypothetical protein